MARTTLNIDDQLARQAKKLAAERGVTLTRLIEDALRDVVAPPRRVSDFQLEWETVVGREVPGVDVADRSALYDRMEDRA